MPSTLLTSLVLAILVVCVLPKVLASDHDDLLPSGLGKVLKPPLDDSRETLVTLLYDENVATTTALGKMKFLHDAKPPYNGTILRVPYLDEECKGKVGVLVTGKVEKATVECVLNFSEKESALIVVTPEEHSPISTVIRVPFIASSGTSSITTSSYAFHLVSSFVLFLAIFICASQ
ncbi:hypothetical protein SprV_0802480200 [Sparganum proliferum]